MNENECKFLSVDDTQSSQNCNDNLGISSNIDRLYITDGNNLQHELSNGNRKKSSNNDECFVENRMFSNTNAYDYEYDRSSKCFHRQKNYFSNTIVSRKLMSAAVTDDNHSDGRNSSASNIFGQHGTVSTFPFPYEQQHQHQLQFNNPYPGTSSSTISQSTNYTDLYGPAQPLSTFLTDGNIGNLSYQDQYGEYLGLFFLACKFNV